MLNSLRPPKILLALLATGLLAMIAGGCSGTTTSDIDRGRTLFIENCGNCHTMAQAGTSATAGPNLDHGFAAARAAGMDAETISGVVKPQVLFPRPSTDNPTVSMPAEIVTGRDLEDVAAYVGQWAGVPDAEPPQVEGGPGAQVFSDFACGSCHTLSEFGSTGSTGPNLDEVIPGLSPEMVRSSIVNPDEEIAQGYSAGIMPSTYGDDMTEQQLEDLVQYLVESTSGAGGGN